MLRRMWWPWGAGLVLALAAGASGAEWRVAPDPHGAILESPRESCPACHLPTHPADVAWLDRQTCPTCHLARRVSEDTRVLPPVDDRQRTGRSADKPLAVTDEMVKIPAGPFVMGYDKRHPDEGPMHTRNVEHAYWIDKLEVTNEAYQKFVKETTHPPPDHWRTGTFSPGEDRLPVVYITWFDARNYCAWAGKRLPTEAEWEKAARGTDGRLFPYGDTFDAKKSNSPQSGIGRLMPVGSFPQGKSPYGLFDVAGNVWEWTDSWYQPYPGNSHSSPNYGEQYRVVRGGSYVDCSFYRCGLSAPTFNRGFFKPETRNSGFGFRCAR